MPNNDELRYALQQRQPDYHVCALLARFAIEDGKSAGFKILWSAARYLCGRRPSPLDKSTVDEWYASIEDPTLADQPTAQRLIREAKGRKRNV